MPRPSGPAGHAGARDCAHRRNGWQQMRPDFQRKVRRTAETPPMLGPEASRCDVSRHQKVVDEPRWRPLGPASASNEPLADDHNEVLSVSRSILTGATVAEWSTALTVNVWPQIEFRAASRSAPAMRTRADRPDAAGSTRTRGGCCRRSRGLRRVRRRGVRPGDRRRRCRRGPG